LVPWAESTTATVKWSLRDHAPVAYVVDLGVPRAVSGGERGDVEEFLTKGNDANEEGKLSADSNRVGVRVRVRVRVLDAESILPRLNISRRIERPFGNFHDPKPFATDFKIRFALKGTSYWVGI
jgi:hypothetical protein